MFCPQCGTQNPEGSQRCSSCGAILPQRVVPAGLNPVQGAPLPSGSVPNYLVQAILVTICCCLPLGIVAIVFAAQVNGKLAAGDLAGAEQASANARKWCWIALIVGIFANAILFTFQIVGMTAAGFGAGGF